MNAIKFEVKVINTSYSPVNFITVIVGYIRSISGMLALLCTEEIQQGEH